MPASIVAWNATNRFSGRIHKEVWSNPDLNAAFKAADELYSPNFVFHDSTGDYDLTSKKKDQPKADQHTRTTTKRFLDMVAEGDTVVTRFLSTGTQKGDLPAIPGYQPLIPANCKPVRIPALAPHRLVNGKLAEQLEYEDNWSANIQAGVIAAEAWLHCRLIRP